MRREYELTEVQWQRLFEVAEPIDAWRELGKELGFRWDTVNPVPGKSDRFFTAEPAAGATPAPSGESGR